MVHDDGMVNAMLHCAIEDISAAATIIDVLHKEKDIMVCVGWLIDDVIEVRCEMLPRQYSCLLATQASIKRET